MAQAQTDVTVRIDTSLKESGEALFRSFGVTFSTGMNALLKEAVQQQRNPLANEPRAEYSPELEAEDPFYTRKVQKELLRRIAAVEGGDYVKFNPLESKASSEA